MNCHRLHEDATPPPPQSPPPPPTFSPEEQVINGITELLGQEFEVDLRNMDVQARQTKFRLLLLKFHPDKWTAVAIMGPVAEGVTKFLNSQRDYYLLP